MYPDMESSEVQTVADAVQASMGIQATGGLFDKEDLPEGADIHIPKDVKEEQEKEKEKGGDNTGGGGSTEQGQGSKQFVQIGNKFINIEHLNVDLIRQINPFQGAYEILSKAVTTSVLKTIQDTVVSMRTTITEEEAVILWPRINQFIRENKREPSPLSSDAHEKRLAEGLSYIKRKAQEAKAQAEKKE